MNLFTQKSGNIKINAISTKTEQQLWDDYRQCPSIDNRNHLVCYYLHLVDKVVEHHFKSFNSDSMDYCSDDLVSEGMIGLIDAVRRFDPNRKLKFVTYSSYCIAGRIKDYLRNNGKLSRGYQAWEKSINAAIEKLKHNDEFVTCQSIAQQTGTTEHAIFKYQDLIRKQKFQHPISTTSLYDSSDDYSFADADNKFHPDLSYYDCRDEPLSEFKHLFPQSTFKILTLYFVQHWTLDEIGLFMNKSMSRISQIMQEAKLTIKHYLQPEAAVNKMPTGREIEFDYCLKTA